MMNDDDTLKTILKKNPLYSCQFDVNISSPLIYLS